MIIFFYPFTGPRQVQMQIFSEVDHALGSSLFQGTIL
jgi:hypothetical protein